MEVPYDPKDTDAVWSENPTLGPVSREKYDWKRHTHLKVHCITIDNSQDMEAKCPGREECTKKHVHT